MLKIRDVAATEKGIRLLAGEQGLDAPVSRAHMVENLEIARNFVADHEMVFTTGAGLAAESELPALVEAAWRSGACGIVVNIGPYIHAVDAAVTAFAQEKAFPLFSCPWEVRMAEIMHRVSCRIDAEGQTEQREAQALRSAILHPEAWRGLQRLGFDESSRFYVAVLSAPASEPLRGAYCFEIGGRPAAVFCDYTREELRALPLAGGAAFGGPCDLLSLGCGYREAKRLFALPGPARGPRFFEESGIYQLLLGVEDRHLLESYCNSTLGPLVRHDAKKKGDLLQTLEVYLRCGGSLKEASAQLGIHKNTVTNKVRRCGELLGVDLAEQTGRVSVEVALLARQALQRME